MSSKSKKKSVEFPEEVQFANEEGVAHFSLYENRKYEVQVIRPRDGKTISKEIIEPTPQNRAFTIQLPEGLPVQADTTDFLSERIRELVSRGVDSDLQSRLDLRAKAKKEQVDRHTMRWVTGGRMEELVFRALRLYKGTVFDDVVWNGKTGEWGLPVPAQKVSEQTGKKLPDIMAFQGSQVYVIETTLLRGRAQWKEPEAVSVPDHVEDALSTYPSKSVSGVFIAPKLDPSAETNLVTRARDKGYRIVPLEIEDFLKIIGTMSGGAKDYWENNLATLWNVLKRIAVRAKT